MATDHLRLLNIWLALQSAATRAALTPNDIAHYEAHGTFPPRSIGHDTPHITLRLEIWDATTAHLPVGIHRPHFDIHPHAAPNVEGLITVLRRQISGANSHTTALEMDDREGIESIGYIKMGAGVSLNAWDFNEAYVGWWERQFCFGRNAVVIVKVKIVA